jgi:hypothetical protein
MEQYRQEKHGIGKQQPPEQALQIQERHLMQLHQELIISVRKIIQLYAGVQQRVWR